MRVWIERNGKRWRVRYQEDTSGPRLTAETVKTKREALVVQRAMETAGVVERYPGQLFPLPYLAREYVKVRVKDGYMSDGYAKTCVKDVDRVVRETGWRSVTDVTSQSVRQWRSTHPSVGKWRNLRAVLRWSYAEMHQPVDPRILERSYAPQRPNKAPRATLLSDDLVAKIIRRAYDLDAHAGAVVHFLATYGCRPITAMHIKVGDVDLRDSTLYLRHNKNRMDYTIPLTEQMLAAFEPCVAGRNPSERLFIDPMTGNPHRLSAEGTASPFSRWYKRHIGYDLPEGLMTPYCLKDWAISKMVQAGIPDHEIILFTGHKNTDVLIRYKKSNMDRQRDLLSKLGGANLALNSPK